MRPLRSALVPVLGMLILVSTACSRPAGQPAADSSAMPTVATVTGDFTAPLGVQAWSFRALSKDVPAMLSTIRGMGFTHIETAGLYGKSRTAFAAELETAGLKATSMHVDYTDLKERPDSVIADAKALGAKYVGIAWYPHSDSVGFTPADARQAVQDFNAFGRTLKAAGITFFYHLHGYEPVPNGADGTLLDLLITQTDSALVAFEMDVLWTWLPGQDPVGLIKKYPGRFKLMHIKDMKPGVPRGSLSGGIPDSLKAPIGAGQVDWPALLQAAVKDGVAEFYLEDETTDPVRNAPISVKYLLGVKFP
ncbi:MAG: sugar phosphate isomerase/epimerase [Gemmatimonadaceae bacterium]|nr:sugar phosphate isomerase/epimerase [Gemmatimonadaceae bacterium]